MKFTLRWSSCIIVVVFLFSMCVVKIWIDKFIIHFRIDNTFSSLKTSKNGIAFNLKQNDMHTSLNQSMNLSANKSLGLEDAKLQPNYERMFLCLVCCGEERLNETQTALKSAMMFSSSPLTLIVFTEPRFFAVFTSMWERWPLKEQQRVQVMVREAKYPSMVQEAKWRKLFRECASLRLFLPDLLPDTPALLYVDTDVLFVSPVEDLWADLAAFNATQLAAVAPEHQLSATGWYNRFAKHPYYGKLGVNSGVMLMQLERMRTFGWLDYIIPLKEQYEKRIRWGDQDIINILFHFHPELVYEWDCSYNYRPDHCMYGSVCRAADKGGVRVLHASRQSANTDHFPPFRDIYTATAEFDVLHGQLYSDLYQPLQLKLVAVPSAKCSLGPDIYLRRMRLYTEQQQQQQQQQHNNNSSNNNNRRQQRRSVTG